MLIVKKDEVPGWMIGNKYIQTGYRVGYDTYFKTFISLFHIHNETINVWTHLLAAILFVGFSVYVMIYLAPPLIAFKSSDTCTVESRITSYD